VHLPAPLRRAPGAEPVPIRYDPEITRLVCAGRVSEAAAAAVHRLRASGLPPMVNAVPEAADLAPRIAAALLFPVSEGAVRSLADRVLLPAARPLPGSSGR
jgi:CRISPR-associated protein Csx17